MFNIFMVLGTKRTDS